ncbi:MAG: YcdB/YcdC domain-containing protein, partial [Priestia megaterium]
MEQILLLDQENSEDYSELHNAIESLKKDYQMAIVLHYFYDFKVFEIAEILGKPNNTIKMHLHRGRKAIRLKLEETMQKPLQQKDVKRMLKEQLLDLAKQYGNVPTHYELELENYLENGISSYMWKGQSKDEVVFMRLDEKGRLDDFAKSATKEGPSITEEMKLEIAQRQLREQHPEALSYYTLIEQNKRESSTSFKFGQVVSGFPLDGFYCLIEVTNPGEVIQFTYTGYMENPPEMPKKLYPTERILNTMYEGEWLLGAASFNNKYDSVPESGICAIYESERLTQAYDAVTGKPFLDDDDASTPSYVPFPKVEALPKKVKIEEIIGINEEWEQYEEDSMCMDEAYEELNWRPKGWKASEGKSYEHFMKSKFENRVKIKVDKRTKRLIRFMWLTENEGEAKLSEKECLQIAARFIQTYYPEYTSYLYVEVKKEEDLEKNRAFFRFVVHKDGLFVENEFFHMNICKKTGAILMFSAANIAVEFIEKFEPKAIKPIKELLPLKGLKVQLMWDRVYGKTEQDEDEMRLIYRIQMSDGAF